MYSETHSRTLNLVDQGEIFHGTPGSDTASCCFPSLAQLNDGTVLVSWRAGSQKDTSDGDIYVCRSNDGCKTWSKPVRPFRPLLLAGEAHYAPFTILDGSTVLVAIMWVDRADPGKPFFNPKTEGLLPIQTFFLESQDGGLTWHNLSVLDSAPYDSPMPITGPVLRLPDDRLACQFEVNKNYLDEGPWRHAAALKFSSDGINWHEHVEVANDPENQLMFWDARYTHAGRNRYVATFWTYNHVTQRDTHIHFCHSDDACRTWSTPKPTSLIGQVAHPVHLDGDELVLIYVDRYVQPGIRAVLTDTSIQAVGPELDIYKHHPTAEAGLNSDSATYLQDMELWTFGRVDAIRDIDGSIIVVYYAGNTDATGIHWARLTVQ